MKKIAGIYTNFSKDFIHFRHLEKIIFTDDKNRHFSNKNNNGIKIY